MMTIKQMPHQAVIKLASASVVAYKAGIVRRVTDPGTAKRSRVHGQLQPLWKNRTSTLLGIRSLPSVHPGWGSVHS